MYVTEITPLIKNAPKEPLSYYTSQELPAGSIVWLPVRKKIVSALVLSQTAAPLSKLTLKAASFNLRRLPQQENPSILPQAVLKLAEAVAAKTPYGLGTILRALIPSEVLTGDTIFTNTPFLPKKTQIPTVLLADNFENRLRIHKINIREAFARNGSVLLIAPTHQEALFLYEVLRNGIEKRAVFFSHRRTKKQLERAYAALNDTTNTKLIIATPQYTAIARSDITQIILEYSRSPHYTQKQKPYLNLKEVIVLRAQIEGAGLTLADILPLSEDEWKRREGVYEPSDQSFQRLSFDGTVQVVTPLKKNQTPFLPIYEKSSLLLENALAAGQRIFVYAARRGMAPMIVCRDCGHIFRCPTSGAPYSLFKTKKNGEEQRWFVSSSGTRIRAFDVCTECSSWRLIELGVGIQKIEEQLKKQFNDTPIIVFDHTTATTPRKAQELIGKFYDTKSAILLGTSMVLPYLTETVDTTLVTSVEALRSNPTWRAEEDALALLLTLRDKTSDTVLLQTKHETDETLIQYTKNGQIEKFYDEELALRKELSYPPFSVFVHCMFVGTKTRTSEIEKTLSELLAPYTMRFYSSPTSTVDEMVRFGLLRIEREKWPDTTLLESLRSLPPYIRVEITPARLV